jgi:hypothetical protein
MFVLCLATVSCSHQDSNAPTRIRIAGGPPADTFSVVANALASLYSQRVPNVSSEALQTTGTTENIDAVENGDAECGLGSADLVYNARLRGTSGMAQPHTHLRGVAVLFPNAVHLTTRANSGVATLADLAGKRIAAAVPGDVSARGRGFRMEAVASSIADLSVRHTRPTTVVLRIDDAVSQLGACPSNRL